jgi:hypothetical protein
LDLVDCLRLVDNVRGRREPLSLRIAEGLPQVRHGIHETGYLSDERLHRGPLTEIESRPGGRKEPASQRMNE